jgi:hypothetical protein
MNTPVSLKLAKLLKEKGFDEYTKLCVEDDDDRALPFDAGNYLHKNSLHPYYSAPLITEVVMWMYEKHGIWIYPSQNSKGLFQWNLDYNCMGDKGMLDFNSPTKAYEAAIEYCLKKIL